MGGLKPAARFVLWPPDATIANLPFFLKYCLPPKSLKRFTPAAPGLGLKYSRLAKCCCSRAAGWACALAPVAAAGGGGVATGPHGAGGRGAAAAAGDPPAQPAERPPQPPRPRADPPPLRCPSPIRRRPCPGVRHAVPCSLWRGLVTPSCHVRNTSPPPPSPRAAAPAGRQCIVDISHAPEVPKPSPTAAPLRASPPTAPSAAMPFGSWPDLWEGWDWVG